MVGRNEQIGVMRKALTIDKSSFVAITGRRRVGKTYIVREVYKAHFCFTMTGIQHASISMQIGNFMQKLSEFSGQAPTQKVKNWLDAFFHFKSYLLTLPKDKKHVIFIDELPWIATAKSGFVQQLAHLWNDYLSAEKYFILVVCGSATSWITNKIINDKGGFHNRVSIPLHLKPFTLAETKAFLQSKNIELTDSGIAEIYMSLGGLPYYLEQIEKGESPAQIIERLCFSRTGILKYEYNNLYKALFDNWQLHEAIVRELAMVQKGLSRREILERTKISDGGNFNRVMEDLLLTDFVVSYHPFGAKKRESNYRLADEFSVFYHRFMKENEQKDADIWKTIYPSQAYKIWRGYAFESLCLRHISEIKNALGIKGVYTETSGFFRSKTEDKDCQIDLIIDRKDATINLCECKFYESSFSVNKEYADELKLRKVTFQNETKTKKNLFTTLITNEPLRENAYSKEAIDVMVQLNELMV